MLSRKNFILHLQILLLLFRHNISTTLANQSNTYSTTPTSTNNVRPWLNGIPTNLPFLSKTRISNDTHIYDFSTSIDSTSTNQTPITLGIDICSCILVSPPNNRTLIRPYTPISSRHQISSFSILVKTYPNGAMSAEFEKLKPGDSMVFWQIPFNKKIQYPFQNPKTIIMLAAGTGITPMYQALNRMFGKEEQPKKGKTSPLNVNDGSSMQQKDPPTRVILIYASRTKKDIYLRQKMEKMKRDHPDQLEIIHVLSNYKKQTLEKKLTLPSLALGSMACSIIEKGRINEELIHQILLYFLENVGTKRNKTHKDEVQFWICGPPSFYSSLCGPREDKAVSGILKNLGFRSDQVVKF